MKTKLLQKLTRIASVVDRRRTARPQPSTVPPVAAMPYTLVYELDRLLDYHWAAEEDDYESAGPEERHSHIFDTLVDLRHWTDSAVSDADLAMTDGFLRGDHMSRPSQHVLTHCDQGVAALVDRLSWCIGLFQAYLLLLVIERL